MRFIIFIVLVVSGGCARGPIKEPTQALRGLEKPMDLKDDLKYEGLIKGISDNIARLKENEKLTKLQFGPREISKSTYLAALEELKSRLKKDPTGQSFHQHLQGAFQVMEVYGGKDWGEVLVTSYFAPEIEGSVSRTKRFTQPIYAIPEDLVSIRVDEFAKRLPIFEPLKDKVLEQKSRNSVARGRLIPKEPGSTLPAKVIPYYDRKELDAIKRPLPAKLILCWADPIDVFFLQIQGSGRVRLQDGRVLRIGYAAQNGHPYVAIGSHLLDKIPKEKMSLQSLDTYLRSVSEEERQRILNLNPSYVFFQRLKKEPLTYFGTEVVAGRTIATDYQYFPKGTLAYLEYEKPRFKDGAAVEPEAWEPSSRFVLDTDTGGAIRGPHRVDLYWGRGAVARQAAGVMKNPGRLYYFVPTPETVERLKSE